MPNEQRRLRVIAGPNGSGKSTLYNLVSKQVQMGEYVNADAIGKELSERGSRGAAIYLIIPGQLVKLNFG